MIDLYKDTTIQIVLIQDAQDYGRATVRAIQVKGKSGFAFTNLSAAKIAPTNFGQDFTYLIGNTPSAVTTSDAGTGVGYTGIRIRGSDATRINVTVNGIPINDAESHGVYWVNMPDLASSTNSAQIQRGVGSSTIGTGAFGANINIQNTDIPDKPSATFSQSYGSFNTAKSTILFNTGQINHFNFGGRLSRIVSDGFIDRASSDLQAFQFNLGYTKKRFKADLVSFGGKEKTYQSWYGTPESRIKNDIQGMNDYADRNYLSSQQRAELLNSGRTYNYYTYANQTDNYWQNHYQMHLSYIISDALTLRSAFFTTTGKGYYQEFREGASFADYRVNDYINGNDTITSTNLVRQRWLDNIFYGNFTSLNYTKKNTELTLGLSATSYDGEHFGRVIWAEIASPFGLDNKYYQSFSHKDELNTFIKWNQKLNKHWKFDADLQYRHIKYNSKGNDNDGTPINFDVTYQFFNPKASLVYLINRRSNLYSSISFGSREPIRSDFIDNYQGSSPKHERLRDIELGYIYQFRDKFFQFNYYDMNYKNQLVVTGELNDVGNALRRNVAQSFRRGVEIIVQYPLIKKLSLDANLTLSTNKIKNFEDAYYDYDQNTYIKTILPSTDIAFSPAVVGFLGITDRHLMNLELSFNVKHVGKQYLDNTLNNSATLPAYTLLNFQFNKTFNFLSSGEKIIFKGMVNNLTGIFYSNNGWTYKYVYGANLTRENFYFPQAGRNFMMALELKF
ncbi:MAG: TonB-dependent receptor plug domain-containing protein [Bacteroidetes bacterium]|nr:TonB-dependent receptor plug domain-containing protein [Bacteroidota bacterium]